VKLYPTLNSAHCFAPLHAGSDGRVIALGDPARLEDVLEIIG
jgi:hypothetical protein